MPAEITTYNKISSKIDVKIEPFDVSKRVSKPHKHNKYLEIVYFIKGSGYHNIDFKNYVVRPQIVFLIKKGQVHNWELQKDLIGYVIIIKESFLSKTLDKVINSQLIKLMHINKIDISNEDKSLKHFCNALCWEMNQEYINQEVIEGGLKAILSKLVRYADVKDEIVVTTDQATVFLNLLSENLKNNVSFYAQQQNTTSQNLNAVCNKVFNKTASDVIAEHIIKEVKRQLLYTSKLISDIAYDLDFKDASHFSKYFKRHTGQTPLEFKKNQE